MVMESWGYPILLQWHSYSCLPFPGLAFNRSRAWPLPNVRVSSRVGRLLLLFELGGNSYRRIRWPTHGPRPLITERGVIKTQKTHGCELPEGDFIHERQSGRWRFRSIHPRRYEFVFSFRHAMSDPRISIYSRCSSSRKMTEDVIGEIERKKVPYLLWSNRTFAEYGVPVFGRFYDTYFADYLTSHYCPVGPVFENKERGWNAVVWKRMTDEIEPR